MQGFGLVTTVATPVYLNVTGKPASLLGVMATEIAVDDILDTLPVNT